MPDDRSTHALLRRLSAARAAGNADAARDAWRLLVERELPRVRGIVQTFRNDALPGRRVQPADVDEVVDDVWQRIHEATLQGGSIGELRNFFASTARIACLDHVRQHVRHDVHAAGSLDEPGPDGEGASAVALEAEREHGDLTDPARTVAQGAHLAASLAKVDPEKREVLLLGAEGYSGEEIAARLGVSVANVYQRRRRGQAQLRAALDEEPD